MPLPLATLPAAPTRDPAARAPEPRPRRRRLAEAAAHAAVAVSLVAVAAWLRHGPLAPSSLWLDDAWVALVTRADSVGSTAMVGATAPGFAFLLKGWSAIVGFTEARAQALPFAFGVAGPALAYLVAVRRRLHPGAALVAAAVLVTAPVHVEYATRVKHYTLDVVLALVLVAVTWWALDDLTRHRRWFAVSAAAVVATAASGALAAYAGAAAIAGAVALRPGAHRVTRSARTAGLSALAGYAAFAAAWWWAVLRPAVNPHLRAYWSDRYVDVDEGAGAAARALGRNLVAVLDGFSAAPVAVAGVLVGVGVAVLAVRRPPLAALLAGPVVVAVALATLQIAPLGGGRTDAYLYPALALLAAAAVDGCWRIRWAGALAVTGVAMLLAAGTATPDPYPEQDVRPLVAEVERRAGAGDAIVVYPATIWAYALYTDRPVALVADRSQGWGFEPLVDDPRVVRLGRHRDRPERYRPEVDRVAARHDEVWLVASHWRDDLAEIDGFLADAGLDEIGRWERPGARLSRFTAGLR